MSKPIWSRSTGRSRISAQPTTCSDMWEAIRFIHQKGGSAGRQELLAQLVRSGRGLSDSGGIVQMLSSYNFVRKRDNTDRSIILVLQDWVATLSNGFKSK